MVFSGIFPAPLLTISNRNCSILGILFPKTFFPCKALLLGWSQKFFKTKTKNLHKKLGVPSISKTAFHINYLLRFGDLKEKLIFFEFS